MADAGDDATLGLRRAWLAVEELRGDVLRLAAQVVALTEELAVRAPADPALEARVQARTAALLPHIQAADAGNPDRLQLGDHADKYEVVLDDGPPCAELLPICGARCCSFVFALSTQDLDEGVIRWSRGQPYLIAHDDDGRCTHLDRGSQGCGAYAHRPAPCRSYDCRQDPRVWTDYAARVLAAPVVGDPPGTFDVHERVRRRELALAGEASALRSRNR